MSETTFECYSITSGLHVIIVSVKLFFFF